MSKLYFVISDIHGHYDEMMQCLNLFKYDKDNNNHHLLILGDMFDRGNQSKEVFEFLYELRMKNRATVILGNHETFLIEFLDGNYGRALFNMKFNGFKKTLESLVERKLSDEEKWDEVNLQIKERYIHLYDFLKTLPLYIEIKDYIFVHGGIKYNKSNWDQNSKRDYIWGRESNFDRIQGKTVVCGHERVSTIRYPKTDQHKLFLTNPEAFDILEVEGKIHIDAYVEISKKINVLNIEFKDEDL